MKIDPWHAALAQVLILVLCAMLKCAKTALCEVNVLKMKKQNNDDRTQAILKLHEREYEFYASVRFWMLLGAALLGMLCLVAYAPRLEQWMPTWCAGLLLAFVAAFVSMIFCKNLPNSIGMKFPEESLRALYPFMICVFWLARPFVIVSGAVANLFAKLFSVDPSELTEELTEDEIRLMVDMGSESGAIAPEEKELIQNIFEFDSIAASSVMTHRTEVAVLMLRDTPQEWEKIVRDTGFSRFPVCDDTIDDIVGILHARELYEFLYDGSGDVKSILRPAYVVPETVSADVLLRNMQKEKTHLAIVVDEYGGFSGVVSMDDLLEEIVGEIDDEKEEQLEPEPIVQVGENEWEIDGTVPLDEVAQAMDMELPTEEFDTLGGMIYAQIDYVPDDGTQFSVEAYGLGIDVQKIADRRIALARVHKLLPASETEGVQEEKE